MKLKLAIIFGSVALLACNNQNGLGYGGADGTGANGVNYTQDNNYGGNYGTGGNGSGITSGSLAANAGNISYFNQTIGDTVNFIVDSAELTEAAKGILNSQAEWLKLSNHNVLIEGHADEQGTREYNLALGARRAASVRDYLASRGIAQSRISVVTFGKERPLAVCSTEECWYKNRRAVTVVK